jgi:hypothetical protein
MPNKERITRPTQGSILADGANRSNRHPERAVL